MIISLHSLTLDVPLNQTGECLVLTELLLPRNGIARKAALKDIHVSKGKRSFARVPFYEKGLLKEKVDGPVGLKVSLTRPLKHPELVKFARKLLGTAIESTSDLLQSSLINHRVLEDLVESSSDQLADHILEDAPDFIATGGIDFDSERLTTGKVAIPLKLTKALRRSDQPPGPKSRDKRKANTKHYRKGSPIGELSLDFLVD